jgi:hypothetical protein
VPATGDPWQKGKAQYSLVELAVPSVQWKVLDETTADLRGGLVGLKGRKSGIHACLFRVKS